MRVARARIKFLEEQLEHKEQSIIESYHREQRLDQMLRDLKQKGDDRMLLSERRQLCNSIGQMTEAVAHAIRFVVGKEQL